jgi:hypothetical protein
MSPTTSEILPLRAAYEYAATREFADEMTAIREMDIEWDEGYTSSLRRGYVIRLLEQKGLFDDFKRSCWSGGNTPAGERKYRWYIKLKDRYESFLAGRGSVQPDAADKDGGSDRSLEFALEAHLRDFLARNLDRIEPGLTLYTDNGVKGIEYPVEGGRIDLLATDRQGRFVVLELKLSQGRTKALGQLLYYMGWVDRHLGKGRCRGIIIASEIGEELATAVGRAPGVSVAEYRMNFSIEPRHVGVAPAV